MLALEGALVALEDRYGLSPNARFAITIKQASAQGELPLVSPADAGLRSNQPGDGRVLNFPGIGAVKKG